MTRVWRSPRGFVVEGARSPEALVSSLAEHLPAGAWREYVRIDDQGRVRDTLRPGVWSIEEELGASAYAVVDGVLRNFRVSLFYGRELVVRRKEEDVEGGLREVSGDPECLRVVDAALSARAGRETEVVDARLAALPGALEDYGAGKDFRAAQEALAARYRRHGDALDREVLRALARFGRLHRSLRSAAFAVALDAYVVACRLLLFDRTLAPGEEAPLPSAGAFAGVSEELRAELASLTASLRELDRNVYEHAEWQEDVDARLNAIQMKKACRQIGLAHLALEAGA